MSELKHEFFIYAYNGDLYFSETSQILKRGYGDIVTSFRHINRDNGQVQRPCELLDISALSKIVRYSR